MSKTLTDMFEEHLGAKEYDSFVSKMIKWYYGYDAKVAWCAISMSYMANQLGILDQFGGKHQNCYEMLTAVKLAVKKTGKGKVIEKDQLRNHLIKRGTVIFVLNDDPPMKYTSKKHVTTAYKDFVYKGTGTYENLGGNQSDMIKVKTNAQSRIWAIFEPDYGEEKSTHKTLRKGDKGDEVKELQQNLKKLGFGRITGHTLLAGGSFKTNTYNCVKAFQKWTKCCSPDGVAGPKTWAMIDKMLATPLHTTEAIANVYVRTGPSTDFKKVAKVLDGTAVQYTNIIDGWIYIPKHNGWSKSSYYKL